MYGLFSSPAGIKKYREVVSNLNQFVIVCLNLQNRKDLVHCPCKLYVNFIHENVLVPCGISLIMKRIRSYA